MITLREDLHWYVGHMKKFKNIVNILEMNSKA